MTFPHLWRSVWRLVPCVVCSLVLAGCGGSEQEMAPPPPAAAAPPPAPAPEELDDPEYLNATSNPATDTTVIGTD